MESFFIIDKGDSALILTLWESAEASWTPALSAPEITTRLFCLPHWHWCPLYLVAARNPAILKKNFRDPSGKFDTPSSTAAMPEFPCIKQELFSFLVDGRRTSPAATDTLLHQYSGSFLVRPAFSFFRFAFLLPQHRTQAMYVTGNDSH